MLSLGISPGDGLKLMEYHESAWFIKEAIRIKQKKDNTELINISEAHRMAIVGASSKKGLASFQKWIAGLKDSITDDLAESGEETLFDHFKKQAESQRFKKPALTFWDRIKKK